MVSGAEAHFNKAFTVGQAVVVLLLCCVVVVLLST